MPGNPHGKSTVFEVLDCKETEDHQLVGNNWVEQEGRVGLDVLDPGSEDDEEEILYELRKLELERRLRRLRLGRDQKPFQTPESPRTVVERPYSKEGTSRQETSAYNRVSPTESEPVRFHRGVSVIPEGTQYLAGLLARVDLPKLELIHFEGDSLIYHQFIRQFELHVESRVDDPCQRLSFLLNYTKGRAKRAIEGCVMLPPLEGYMRARTILKDLFGRSYAVGRA
jgi:hypothetical protein